MLDLKKDRTNYKNLLKAPEGYEIEKILITTYSLEMEKIVEICLLALGLQIETTSQDGKNPITGLYALEKMMKKIVVICQNGQIKEHKNLLYLMLEKSIYTINPPKNKNFHPKVILIKYKNKREDKREDKIKYKLIVSSKNLTSDRSWDAQVSIQGNYNINNNKTNQEIVKFIKYLKNNIEQEEQVNKFLEEIENEIAKVDFLENLREQKNSGIEEVVENIEFIQLGANDREKLPYLETESKEKLKSALIISPFLTLEPKQESPIYKIKQNIVEDGKIQLITRRTELTENLLNEIETYVINDQIIDNMYIVKENNQEENEEEFENEITNQDIHAKMYILQKEENTELYVGSANASRNAFNGNIEAMLKITIKQKDFIDKIRENLFGNEKEQKQYFIKAEIKDKEEKVEDNTLQKIKKSFFELQLQAIAEKIGEEYQIIIEVPEYKNIELEQKYEIKIKPLLDTQKSIVLKEKVNFEEIKLEQLSEFYVIEFYREGEKQDSKIIKIPTQNLPKLEQRIGSIYTNIIKGKKELLEYIAFILDDDYGYGLRERTFKNSSTGKIQKRFYIPRLYEKMLKVAYQEPEKIQNIQKTIEKVKERINKEEMEDLEELEDLYNKFKEV